MRAVRPLSVATLLIVLAGCSSSTPEGRTQPSKPASSSAQASAAPAASQTPPSAATLWPRAQSALKKLKSVHLVDDVSGGEGPGVRTDVDVALDGSRASGTMTLGDAGTITLRVVDATRYVTYPRTMVEKMATTGGTTTPAQAKSLANKTDGRWVKLPSDTTTQGLAQTLQMLTSSGTEFTQAGDLAAPDAKVTASTVGSTRAWLITAPTGVKAWIAADGTDRLLRYVDDSMAPMKQTLTLTRFDEPFTVEAPPNAIDATSLPGFDTALPAN